MRRGLVVMLVAVAATAVAPPSRASDEKAACLASYELGQRVRQAGELRRARQQFIVCARDVCPASLRSDCVEWLAETERTIPSILVVARGPDGAEVLDVRVTMDGAVLTEQLDGRAFSADPGEHTFRFEHANAPFVEQRIVLHEGEKAHPVELRFGAPAPPPTSQGATGEQPVPPRRPPVEEAGPASWPPFALLGIGAAALASFAILGVAGRTQQVDQLDRCAPSCPSNEVSSVRTKYLLADVSLGVSIVAVGAAAILFITKPGRSR